MELVRSGPLGSRRATRHLPGAKVGQVGGSGAVTVTPAYPCLRPFPFNEWTVADPITVIWQRPGKPDIRFIISVGFVTDLASIPRLARLLISKSGRHRVPSVIHDWCYEGKTDFTRAEADELFLILMALYQVPIWKRQAMYGAVVSFGWALWD